MAVNAFQLGIRIWIHFSEKPFLLLSIKLILQNITPNTHAHKTNTNCNADRKNTYYLKLIHIFPI